MNERIKLLALQATDTVEVVNPDTGITHHREFFDKEKFAELIVAECAYIAAKNQAENMNWRNLNKQLNMLRNKQSKESGMKAPDTEIQVSRQEYQNAIEVSVIFHEGVKMFAVPVQPEHHDPIGDAQGRLIAEQSVQQEPVAWMSNKDFEPIRSRIMVEAYELADRDVEGYNAIKVMCGDVQKMIPAQRTWVGLTDEEVKATVYDTNNCVLLYEDRARAIEAKLREKNA